MAALVLCLHYVAPSTHKDDIRVRAICQPLEVYLVDWIIG